MTDSTPLTRLSKFLSFVLRHRPESIGIALDHAGWADIADLLACSNAHGTSLTMETLRQIVQTDAKRRYAISEDGARIRANQGHSLPVKIEYRRATPPDRLFHGTGKSMIPKIMDEGLLRMRRQYVHLSGDVRTAIEVGYRRGTAVVVLMVDAARMVKDGHAFYISENGVWQVDAVPAKYIHGHGSGR